MTNDRRTTGKRVQIYLDARHTEWWSNQPRYDRSRIVAEALDLYRAKVAADRADPTRSGAVSEPNSNG